MSLSLLVLWALTGLSAAIGVSYGSYPNPDDDTPPRKRKIGPGPCLVCTIMGVLAGCLGGWAYSQVFATPDSRSGVYAATTSLGAFVLARSAAYIVGAVTNRAN